MNITKYRHHWHANPFFLIRIDSPTYSPQWDLAIISSYRIARGKQHGLVRIRNELIGMHNDQIRTNTN